MTANARKEIYLTALQKNGLDYQLGIAIEELSELIKEICKNKRGYSNRDHLVEEYADVCIILEQLKLVYHIKDDEVEDFINYKLNRLNEELKKQYVRGD